MDIGSESHSVAFLNKAGVLLSKHSKIYNNRAGFDFLLERINECKRRHGFGSIHVGFEPTGHYWCTVVHYLRLHGVDAHFIKTTSLKHQREIDDSSPSKDDDRDAVELGMLLREGKYLDSAIPEGIYLELRRLGKLRQQIMESKTATILRMGGFLDMYFPGLRDVFWSLDAKGLWKLLREAPFPMDVQQMGQDRLRELLSRSSRRRGTIAEKVAMVLRLSQEGIALEPTASTGVELTSYLDLLESYAGQLKTVEKEMGRVIQDNEFCDLLVSIPGVGVVTVATFIGELGNPANFNHPNEIVSFCGLDPSERSSGQYKSGFRISKKGRYLMRTMVYYMGMRVIRWNKAFKQWYERKMKKGGLKKKEAMIAVCIKLIRIIFAMFRDRQAFDAHRLNPKTIQLQRYRLAA
jgi:transposase